jgi:magnesium transporter
LDDRRGVDHIRAVEHTRETVCAIYLIDPPIDVLLRAITLRQSIFADTGATVLSAAPAHAPMSVTPETPEGETVRLISKYNLLAIPVVDTGQHVIGIVTVDDAVDTLVAQQPLTNRHMRSKATACSLARWRSTIRLSATVSTCRRSLC